MMTPAATQRSGTSNAKPRFLGAPRLLVQRISPELQHDSGGATLSAAAGTTAGDCPSSWGQLSQSGIPRSFLVG